MSDRPRGSGRVPPWTLAVAAMLAVQLGSALSVHLIDEVGAGGTAWLRLTAGAVIFLAIARPSFRSLRGHDAPILLGLGVTMGLQTVAFLAAIRRIPLGTTVAIEFLGPLVVAALHSRSRQALLWVGAAGVGVALVTEPWHGNVNWQGVGYAGVAAVGWGVYIVLTQRVGARFTGLTGLALTVPVAAATAAAFGIPQAAGHLTLAVIATSIGLAILLPVLTYSFELLALRRMTPTAFGTLFALEPAIGVILGLIVLHQKLSWVQLTGILVVVLAGAASQHGEAHRPAAGTAAHTQPGTGPLPF